MTSNTYHFEGKVVIVTGGGTGIGRAEANSLPLKPDLAKNRVEWQDSVPLNAIIDQYRVERQSNGGNHTNDA